MSSATPDGCAHVLSAKTTTPENVARAIAMIQGGSEGFRIPLLQAVSRDDVALTVLKAGQAPPLSQLDQTHHPAIIVLTDDDDTTRLGPDGWRYAARILRWARSVFLHGTGGDPAHYKMAVLTAQRHHRLVLVETSSARLEAWAALATRMVSPGRILILQPPDGGVHPVVVPREQLH